MSKCNHQWRRSPVFSDDCVHCGITKTQLESRRLHADLAASYAEVTRLQAEVERLTKERDEKPLPPLSGRVIDCPHCFKSVQLAWIQDEKDAKIAELEARIMAMLEVGKMIPDWLGSPCQKSLKHYAGGGRGPYRPEDSDA